MPLTVENTSALWLRALAGLAALEVGDFRVVVADRLQEGECRFSSHAAGYGFHFSGVEFLGAGQVLHRQHGRASSGLEFVFVYT